MVERNKQHIWVGLGFIGMAIAVAGAMYLGMRFGGEPSAPPTDAAVMEVQNPEIGQREAQTDQASTQDMDQPYSESEEQAELERGAAHNARAAANAAEAAAADIDGAALEAQQAAEAAAQAADEAAANEPNKE